MKVKFETGYRALLLLLAITLAWSLWASVQTNTNAPPAPGAAATNHSSGLAQTVETWEQHPLTFKLDEIEPLRTRTFLGEPLWRYLASLIYLLLAFWVAKLLDWVAAVWLRKITESRGKLRELLLELLRGPVKVVAFVLLLQVGLNFFEWSPKAKLYFSKCLILIVAGSLTYLAVKIVGVLVHIWRDRATADANQKFHSQLFSFVQKSLTAFVIVVGVLVTAQNMGINITAAITSLSIGGLAVGLAAQDTLANLFGAIAVLVDKPFMVGDQIKVESNEGIVEAVGLRSTRLRNPEGYLIAVPNKTMGNATITNVSTRGHIKTVMNLALPYSLPTEKVKRALTIFREVYRNHPSTQDLWVSFNQFTGANLNITVVHWWKGTDYQKYLSGIEELNLAAKQRLEAEAIALV